jgi:hypothetical protein
MRLLKKFGVSLINIDLYASYFLHVNAYSFLLGLFGLFVLKFSIKTFYHHYYNVKNCFFG